MLIITFAGQDRPLKALTNIKFMLQVSRDVYRLCILQLTKQFSVDNDHCVFWRELQHSLGHRKSASHKKQCKWCLLRCKSTSTSLNIFSGCWCHPATKEKNVSKPMTGLKNCITTHKWTRACPEKNTFTNPTSGKIGHEILIYRPVHL